MKKITNFEPRITESVWEHTT